MVLQSPDIVVEYFEMMDRATMRFPEVVLTTPLGDSASNCAVSSARQLSSLCVHACSVYKMMHARARAHTHTHTHVNTDAYMYS
jgi:hypothetical protein